MKLSCIYDTPSDILETGRIVKEWLLYGRKCFLENPREELLRVVSRQNPHDTQLLKKCASALIQMNQVPMRGIDTHVVHHVVHERLIEAKSMLEKVLETNQDDHEARFNLGILQADLDMLISSNRNEHCKEGIESFEITRDEFDLDMLISNNRYEHCKEAIECFEKTREEVDGMEYYGMEDIMALRRYKQDCMDAEIRNASNPNDAHNMRRWGRALMGLFHGCAYTDVGELDMFNEFADAQDYIEEAIEKFKAAVLLEPDDIYSKLQLALARIHNCHNLKFMEAMELSKECDLLEAELSSSRKASPMDVNESGRELSSLMKASPMDVNESGRGAAFGVEYSGRRCRCTGPFIFHPIAPPKYNPHRFFYVERGMTSGVQKFGIPAIATQKHWLTKGGTKFRITGFLLQQLISRV